MNNITKTFEKDMKKSANSRSPNWKERVKVTLIILCLTFYWIQILKKVLVVTFSIFLKGFK